MKTLLKAFTVICVILIIAFGGCIGNYLIKTASTKLDVSKIETFTPAYYVYDALGDAINDGNSSYEKIDDMPKTLKNAFIAIEDRRFYKHRGVDYKGIARAIKNNVFSGKIKEGASTITQQLVKNVYLSGEKTVERKLKEIKLAKEIEKIYTKDEILEKYLNKIYFGAGAYGVKRAAETYFGKRTSELTTAECATLAALVKAPSVFDPYKNAEKCKNRRNLVLKEMLSQNMISNGEYESAIGQKLVLSEKSVENAYNFADEAVGEALKILNKTTQDELVGYKIYTAISPKFQACIPEKLRTNTDYSILITENDSGEIVGYKSSSGLLKRIPASAAKPWLVYAPAIEERIINEATKILDEKTSFGGYSPSNAGNKYYGYVSAKDALAKSLNTPALKIANSLGIEKIKEYAAKMNIKFDNEDLSIALGNLSGGLSLDELSSAYSPFVNGGNYKKSGFIRKIVSPSGKIVYNKRAVKDTSVFSEGVSYIINDMLKESVISGTAKKLSRFDGLLRAKTGTNGNENGNSDAYCIAYTPEYTVCVWLGNADGSIMNPSYYGGGKPAEIVAGIFNSLSKIVNFTDFIPSRDVINVGIDGEIYRTKHRQTLSKFTTKTTEYFWYIKGTEPKTTVENLITPVIKDYKITYNNENILIQVNADDNVLFDLRNEENEIVATARANSSLIVKLVPTKRIYHFTLTPYIIENDKKIYGKIIKLPSIKIDGNPVTNWWLD